MKAGYLYPAFGKVVKRFVIEVERVFASTCSALVKYALGNRIQMKIVSLAVLSLVINCCALSGVSAQEKPAFAFNGVDYFHRWSEKNQHEFTPAKQEDLKK